MSFSEADAIAVAEQVDRLVTTEVGGKFRTVTTRPIIRELYDAARAQGGGAPISYEIAKTLMRACRPGMHVLITTGFMLDLWMQGEADGPPGAAVLARTLERAFDVKPLLLTEQAHRDLVAATVRATGLREYEPAAAALHPRRFSMVDLSLDVEAARMAVAGLFDKFRIAAVLAVEKPGANDCGVYHNSAGRDISHLCGKIEPYLDEATRRGIPAISLLDLGNEIGAGAIAAVARKMPNGKLCACPCGGGNVATSVVTHVFPTFVSNWGAYAIAATLAFMRDQPALLHTPELAAEVLQACGRAGGISAKEGYSSGTVDRVPASIHVQIAELLQYMILAARDELTSR